MGQIKFKATRRQSNSCDSYREINKEGDLKFDMNGMSDDVISLYTKDYKKISIDCDKKTGQFRVFFDDDSFQTYSY